MHNDMQYDPIEGQGQGHDLLKVENPFIYKSKVTQFLPPP